MPVPLLILILQSPPIQLSVLLTGIQTGPLSLAALAVEIIFSGLYLWGVRSLKVRGRHWGRLRTVSFLAGMAVVFIATGSGLASYDDKVFTVHVIQHLLLMNFAPIFIALSAPATLLMQASKRPVQTATIKFLHSKVISILTFPVFAWLANWGTMYIYFLTPIYQLSIEHPLFHDYAHLQFLVAGIIFWTTLIGLDPIRWKMAYGAKLAYLLIGIPFGAFIGITLMSMRTSVSPAHTLADVHSGGALLWVFDEIFTVAALGIIFLQWAKHEERLANRADRDLDRQISEQQG
ncbi:MAG: cytochrome c oxidase assembly protein [Actinomycetota bacterium]|nr:MAG: cytochrome c oxidase assembly protein [Actinomycetota bacterium]